MIFEKLQNIGKALMTIVAVLPAAGLLFRLGANDIFDIDIVEKAGATIFSHLPALFSIGIAYGITKDNSGAAALSGYVGYIILTADLKSINPEINMGVLAGSSFSPSLIDYILNWGISTHPERIIPIGLIFAAIYYFVFSWAIVKFNLPTIGRYDEKISDDAKEIPADEKILKMIESLGGKGNFITLGNCATRLRMTLKDPDKINETELKKLGAMGIFRKGNAVQVVVGIQAEHIANDMKKFLA